MVSSIQAGSSITKMVSTTGRLRNQHFLLTADHLLMELDSITFELVGAYAEGNVEVHMRSEDELEEYVAFAQSAIFHPSQSRLKLNGWNAGIYNGVEYPVQSARREVLLPTDGSFFDN